MVFPNIFRISGVKPSTSDRRDARRLILGQQTLGDHPAQGVRQLKADLILCDAAKTLSIFFLCPSQNQIRFQAGGHLGGVISQRLLPTNSGVGRVRVECWSSLRIRKNIWKTLIQKRGPVMKQAPYYGMQTFHQPWFADQLG